MIRKIIQIDEEKCNGCGLCAGACHEGEIGIVDNKAKLLRDDYCDGLGDCLPSCPVGAISFVEREAVPYDEKAVRAAQERSSGSKKPLVESSLSNWPVQIKLVPVRAPHFHGADLLIAADCTAYAYADFHSRFIRNRITLIGCPKLDNVDYREKLTAILRENNIKQVTVVRMEVPCCSGLEYAVKAAVRASGKAIPWQVSVISTDGREIEKILGSPEGQY